MGPYGWIIKMLPEINIMTVKIFEYVDYVSPIRLIISKTLQVCFRFDWLRRLSRSLEKANKYNQEQRQT